MDSAESSLHNRSYQYVYRVPSPPRIFVPPPIQTSIDSPTAHAASTSLLQPSILFSDYTFLSSIAPRHPQPRDRVIDWTYRERQQAQEILPFLFLGPLAAARDGPFLQTQRITMVLGVRKVMDGFMLNPRAPRDLGLEMGFVDVKGEADGIASFGKVVSMINEHVERRFRAAQTDSSVAPGRVLCFCESGNERSATAVAAYIMAVYGLGLVEAIQIVQGQRFCVNIDDNARTRLDTYGSMLAARRDVFQADQDGQTTRGDVNGSLQPPPSFPTDRMARKRSAERMFEDDDYQMEDVVDEQDVKRDGNAPFSDEPLDDFLDEPGSLR